MRMKLALACSAFALGGCDVATDPVGTVADVRGTYVYSGAQASPALQLNGTLTISAQSADLIAGALSWSEQAVGLEPVMRSGAVSGSVIGLRDVDFDVSVTGGVTRRHVARVDVDTLTGVWVETGSGLSGTFRAVRSTP